MKAILITLRLYWFYCIYKGIKTLEIRKSMPRGFKGVVFAYVSRTNWKQDLMNIPENEREFFAQFVGKVGLKFTLNKVEEIRLNLAARFFTKSFIEKEILEHSCLSQKELEDYLLAKGRCHNCLCGYAWHIDELVVLDRPKWISEFKYYKKFSEIDYMLPIPRKETCERLVVLTRAPQSWQFIEV